jgi:hypothetical protein
MDAAQFALPVRLKTSEREPVREIYSAEEALELLLEWPLQKGRIYQIALNECLLAITSPDETERARRAFSAFARAANILERDRFRAFAIASSRVEGPVPGQFSTH